MKANDSKSEKRNRVLGAEHAFLVHINMEEFVQRFDVANAAAIGACANDAIETGVPPSGTGRVQSKRSVQVSDGSKVHVGAAIAGKSDLDTRVRLARNLHRRI